MAKARFVTEVAPQQVVSLMRRRKQQALRRLDTIAEDEIMEHQLAAYGPPDRDHQQNKAAAGGLMRELIIGNHFSGAHRGNEGGSWEQMSTRQGRRRAVNTRVAQQD